MTVPPQISSLAVIFHALFLRPFVRLFTGINITGRGHLDELNQFIIIANHNSHLDVILLYCLLPIGQVRRTHPVADKNYFSRSRLIFRLVDALLQPIWICRGATDVSQDPFESMKRALDAGRNLIIFPEGTRGRPGEMGPFKSGIGRLTAQYRRVPIIPVFLSGPERALPKASSLLLPFWQHLIVGPPQRGVGSHREITRQLEGALGDLARSALARRRRRKQPCSAPRSVAFLGIDGSGKSTASEMTALKLSENGRVCLVSDELRLYEEGRVRELQPLPSEMLRRRIGAFAKSAGSLKLYKIPKLAELLLRNRLSAEAKRWYAPALIVTDGSPLLNILAWSVLYKPEALDNATCCKAIGILSGLNRNISARDPIFGQFPELLHLRHLGLANLTLPDVVVLIDVDAAVACGRIASRGGQRQVHETEEKLELLRQAYIRVCEAVRSDWHVPTLILDGGQSRERVLDEGLAFVRSSLTQE